MVCLWRVIGLSPCDVHTPNLHTSTPNAFIYFNAQAQRRLIKGFGLATFTSTATRWIWNYIWGLDRGGPSAKACNGVCSQYTSRIFIQSWLLQRRRRKERTVLLPHTGLALLLSVAPCTCVRPFWRPCEAKTPAMAAFNRACTDVLLRLCSLCSWMPGERRWWRWLGGT